MSTLFLTYATPSYGSPQHALILLTNTLAVFYLALVVFLVYLFVLQLTALYRAYAPATTITTLVQLETAWTLVPIAFIALCSLCTAAFLQYADTSSSFVPFTHMLHIEGAQWYWRFDGNDARLLTLPTTLDTDYFGLPRLALTSSLSALPVHQATLFTVTSPDVIHSLSIPALSVKLDCIPGRVSQCSPTLSTVGTYIGYCAELCGLGHSAMPLTLTVYTPTTVLTFYTHYVVPLFTPSHGFVLGSMELTTLTIVVAFCTAPLIAFVLYRVIAFECASMSMDYYQFGRPRFLLSTLTLWSYVTTLVVALHVFGLTGATTVLASTASSWLSLATMIVFTLGLGLLTAVVPVTLRYFVSTVLPTTLPHGFSLNHILVYRHASLDLWLFTLTTTLFYAVLNVTYKLVYFAMRLWLLMTLHIFVSTTLVMLLSKVLYFFWIRFLLYTPLACAGYGGWIMALYLYVAGNVIYLALQLLVYLGYKLSSYLDAQKLDHSILYTTSVCMSWTTMLGVCVGIGLVAIGLAPLLPTLMHSTSTYVSTSYRTTLQTYECGNALLTPTQSVTLHAPPSFTMWFFVVDTLALLVVWCSVSYPLPPAVWLWLLFTLYIVTSSFSTHVPA